MYNHQLDSQINLMFQALSDKKLGIMMYIYIQNKINNH